MTSISVTLGINMVFLGTRHDPLNPDKALPEAVVKALMAPKDDGLGEGEDRLEIVQDEDIPRLCTACGGSGYRFIGFRHKTEPCPDCGGSGKA